MTGTSTLLGSLLDEAEALLFDFDGVLADSEPYYYRSYNLAFEKRGHSIEEEEYWRYWTSLGEGIAGEVRRHQLEISREEMDAIYVEAHATFSAFCESGRIRFFPGMLELLSSLVEAGMPCAVASSSRERDIATVFEKASGSPPPCPVVGRDPALRPKPNPDLFLRAAEVLGVEPGACLAIEDAHKGLEAARAAGMRCVILRNDLNRDLEYPGADAVVRDHASFLSQLRAWRCRRLGPV